MANAMEYGSQIVLLSAPTRVFFRPCLLGQLG